MRGIYIMMLQYLSTVDSTTVVIYECDLNAKQFLIGENGR